jgi:hypothetical protein
MGINDWATDTFDRHFTVSLDGDVVQQFKRGASSRLRRKPKGGFG